MGKGRALSGLEEQQQSKDKGGRKLFSDISAVQVVATALASITSMLLASYIGIAGSVIGVGVASVVSTVAASLYKKFLADSAEKIKELPDAMKSVAHHGHTAPSKNAEPEATGVEAKATAPEKITDHADSAARADDPPERPAAHHKKRLVIICVASALIAVAATAAIVYAATLGQGLGAKPEPIIRTEIEHIERTAPPADDSSSSAPSEDDGQNTDTKDQTNTTNEQTDQAVTQPENTEGTNTQDQQTNQTNQTNQTGQTDQTDAPPANTSDQQPDRSDLQPAGTQAA